MPEPEDTGAAEELQDNKDPSAQEGDREPEDFDEAVSVSMSTAQTGESRLQSKAPLKRGQRAKAKKIATKYKNKDEEDRAAFEALVGSTIGRQKAEAEALAETEREAKKAAQEERWRAQKQKQQKQTREHEEVRRLMLDEGGRDAGRCRAGSLDTTGRTRGHAAAGG